MLYEGGCLCTYLMKKERAIEWGNFVATIRKQGKNQLNLLSYKCTRARKDRREECKERERTNTENVLKEAA